MAARPANRLVGRESSLGLLAGPLKRAAAGHPSVVVVRGETGVGKTALVREFLARADVSVLGGTCVPLAGDPLPYAALSQALRAAGGIGAVQQELRRSPELARLVSTGLIDALPQSASASSRLRLFQAVLGLLGRMGAAKSVVHVVEDLHWADPATLDLLSFLATNLTNERAVVLVSYRTEAVPETDTLTTWMAELGRLRSTDLITLDRLDRQQTADLITALLGARPTSATLDTTLKRSAGNPLFIEQLVLSGGVDGPLPATLHGLLRARVATLPEPPHRMLQALSVVGRPASLPLLARTLDRDVPDVEDMVRPALEAHVVELRADDRIGFHHPAFGEVVYAELLPGERSRMHSAVAGALESVPPTFPGVAGEVARHCYQAGDLPRALTASVRAGDTSRQMYAFEDARTNYLRAIDLLDLVPSDLDGVALRTRAAECSMLVGDTTTAVRLAKSSLDLVGPGMVRASLLERLGHFQFLAGNGVASRAAYEEAIALLPADEAGALGARVYAGLGLLAASWSWFEIADDACQHALELAHTLGARREEGMTLNALGIMAAARGDPRGGAVLLREALVIAQEEAEPDDLAAAYVNLSHVLGQAGWLDEAIDLCQAGTAELDRYGQGRQNGSLLLCNTADTLIGAGRQVEAAELLADALARQPRGLVGAASFMFSARLDLINGDLESAAERCQQARRSIHQASAPIDWVREVTETAAEVELWSGRPEPALGLVTEGLRLIAATDGASSPAGLVALGLRALADDAIVRRDPDSRAARLPARDRLLAELAAPDVEAGAVPQDADPVLLLCGAELGRLDDVADPEPWAVLGDAWKRVGRPFDAAYAAWREAEAHLAVGVQGRSIHALRSAHGGSRALGAKALTREVESLARWYRVDLLEPAGPEGVRDDACLDAYGLTDREREVLAALAAGQSNKEIADRLFISAKTASVHVSNILRKLDVPGRQAAARIAHRLGVTD